LAVLQAFQPRLRPVLSPNEHLLEAGEANWVQMSDEGGRGWGEGALVKTDQRLLFVASKAARSLSIPLADIEDVRTRRIAIPNFVELVVLLRPNASSSTSWSFYCTRSTAKEMQRSVQSLASGGTLPAQLLIDATPVLDVFAAPDPGPPPPKQYLPVLAPSQKVRRRAIVWSLIVVAVGVGFALSFVADKRSREAWVIPAALSCFLIGGLLLRFISRASRRVTLEGDQILFAFRKDRI
jgi:hypothetical protein